MWLCGSVESNCVAQPPSPGRLKRLESARGWWLIIVLRMVSSRTSRRDAEDDNALNSEVNQETNERISHGFGAFARGKGSLAIAWPGRNDQLESLLHERSLMSERRGGIGTTAIGTTAIERQHRWLLPHYPIFDRPSRCVRNSVHLHLAVGREATPQASVHPAHTEVFGACHSAHRPECTIIYVACALT
jgi:hypothetical protein